MSNPQYHPVYKLRFNLAIQDPDMPSPRYHTILLVETDPYSPNTGIKFHVTGDIVSGMTYASTPYQDPDELLHSRELIGYTPPADFLQKWDAVLKTVPAPPKQKAFNMKTMKTEPVKSLEPLVFYEKGDVREPLVKCTEWVEQGAVPALLDSGLLLTSV